MSVPSLFRRGSTLDPFRLLDSSEYELREEEEAFVLSVELPGFDRDEITLSWDDGVLNVAAEREAQDRGERRTYHRRFRFPKEVEADEITAKYTNGILEVRLPTVDTSPVSGRTVPVEA
jgi:HSP20 family protein